MEKKKIFVLVIILILIATFLTIGTSLLEKSRNKKDNQETNDNSLIEMTQPKNTTSTTVKKDLVEGKKYITIDNKNYINFPSKGVYNKYNVSPNGTNSTSSGKYSINNKRITLENLKLEAYYNDDYILIKDGLYGDNIFTMYYESTKNDKFIENLSSVIPDYVKKNVETNEDLQEILNKIEVESIDYCYKYSKDDSEFSCSVNYRVYVEDYDYKNDSYYDTLFAGSGATYEKLYIKRWSFLAFKPKGSGYEVTGSFTGM